MKNDLTRAGAECMPEMTISRRAFLRSTAGAATLGGMSPASTPSEALIHDPMLVAIKRYREAEEGLRDVHGGDEVDAYCAEHLDPIWHDMADNTPEVATMESAIEALSVVAANEDWIYPYGHHLVRAALAYFEKRAV